MLVMEAERLSQVRVDGGKKRDNQKFRSGLLLETYIVRGYTPFFYRVFVFFLTKPYPTKIL